VLADPLTAPHALPPYDNSAVDGYAVRGAELAPAGPTRLAVAGRIAAGGRVPARLPARSAVRIFTGAMLPPGFDSVAMQEHVELQDGAVLVPPGLTAGANRRLAGEDVPQGAVVMTPGQLLRPPEVGLAAALGVARLTVRRRLRVALFSTGAELREPGAPLDPGAIHDANRYTLKALLHGLGCHVTDLGILPDSAATIEAALAGAAGDHDLLVTSGGVSLGEEDHVRAAVERRGRLHLWRLALKPGKPVALGQLGDVPLLALPGNPVAVLVAFLVLGRPLVQRLAGARVEAPPRYPLPAGFAHAKKPGRREFLQARLHLTHGRPEVKMLPRQGAALLSPLVEAEGLVELDEDCTGVAAGDIVSFLPLAGLL
jgi:molybdopterin molybdotransferase